MGQKVIEWEKIFTNHVLDKGLLLKMYKEVSNLNSPVKIGKRHEESLMRINR